MEQSIELQDRELIENHEFVSDLARYSESLLTEKHVRRKYGNLDEASWTRLAENEELIAAIETEKIRRMRDGSTKRELAQKHITRGPEILNGIAADSSASPRHRVDAIKVLDVMAANGPAAAAAGTFFEITINLGSDVDGRPIVEHFKKPIAIDSPSVPNDGDPLDDVDTSAITVIPAKPTDDGNE